MPRGRPPSRVDALHVTDPSSQESARKRFGLTKEEWERVLQRVAESQPDEAEQRQRYRA